MDEGREPSFPGMRHGTRVFGVSLWSAFSVGAATMLAMVVAVGSHGGLAAFLLAILVAPAGIGILRVVEHGRPYLYSEAAVWLRTHGRCTTRRYWAASTVDPIKRGLR